MQHETNEAIIGTKDGMIMCRTIKSLPREEWEGALEEMKWTPWMMTPGGFEQQAQEKKEPKAAIQEEQKEVNSATRMPGRSEFEGGGARTAVGSTLRSFQGECGRTEGFAACTEGAMGRHHTAYCQQRRQDWQKWKLKRARQEEEEEAQVKRIRQEEEKEQQPKGKSAASNRLQGREPMTEEEEK